MKKNERIFIGLFLLGVICSCISMLWTAFDLDGPKRWILMPILLWLMSMFLTLYRIHRNKYVQTIIIPFIAMFLFLTVRCDLKGVVVYNIKNKSYTTAPFITFINPFLERQVIVSDLDFERIEGQGRGLHAGRRDDHITINYKANIIFSHPELMAFIRRTIGKGLRPYVIGDCFVHNNLQNIIAAYASENKVFTQPQLLGNKLSLDLENMLLKKGIKADAHIEIISIWRETYLRDG